MMGGLAGAASAANNPVAADSAQGMNGAGAGGGALSQQKDAKDSSTEAKFGDVLKNLQTQYGEKKEKPREIKKTLDKDDFLKIMITQMRHQDPTSPFKPEQMASEIAQFTSLEQLKNVNDNLGKLAKANQPSERLAMTSLIGKTVTVDRDRFNHTEGQNEVVSFKLPRDAKSAKVALIHENGETVLEREIGSNKQGEVSFQWDGLKSNTLPAKGGNYMLQVDARDERDVPIPVSGQAQVRVIGVSFEGSEPVFLVGDAKTPSRVTMKSIVKIEENGSPSAPTDSAAPKSNLIAFEKGKGSSNLEPDSLPPEAKVAIAKIQQQLAPAPESKAPAPEKQEMEKPVEKGFPNGLHDQDN